MHFLADAESFGNDCAIKKATMVYAVPAPGGSRARAELEALVESKTGLHANSKREWLGDSRQLAVKAETDLTLGTQSPTGNYNKKPHRIAYRK